MAIESARRALFQSIKCRNLGKCCNWPFPFATSRIEIHQSDWEMRRAEQPNGSIRILTNVLRTFPAGLYSLVGGKQKQVTLV